MKTEHVVRGERHSACTTAGKKQEIRS